MRNDRGARGRARIRQFPNHLPSARVQRSAGGRLNRRRSPPSGWVWIVSAPQVSQGGGGPVMRPLNAQMSGDSYSEFRIDRGHTRLAIHCQKFLFLGKRFKFFFYLSLINDEGLK